MFSILREYSTVLEGATVFAVIYWAPTPQLPVSTPYLPVLESFFSLCCLPKLKGKDKISGAIKDDSKKCHPLRKDISFSVLS